jgi:hypothetical protein
MNLNIVLAPKDINFVPSEDAMSEVEQYLEEQFQDYFNFIDVGSSPRLFYIDEGDSYLPAIGCPLCNTKISTEGKESAWTQTLREELSNPELDLNSHSVRMPCCGNEASVIRLDFGGRAGFARFSITLEDADISEQEEELIAEAERILGCGLTKIELMST